MKQMLIDGIPTIQFGFMPSSRPSEGVPTPQFTQSDQVIGRDGSMYRFEGTFDDYKQTIQFSFVSSDEMNWHEAFRKVKRFLLKGGLRKYEHEDNPHFFKIIKKIEMREPERPCLRGGTFECDFIFAPYEYRNDGQIEHSLNDCLYNPYSLSKPLYKITGNGSCKLSVNGNVLEFNVSGYASVDSELGLAYRDKDQLIDTKGCSISDLALIEDMNDIQISEGFDLKIVPRWRCI